MGRGRDSDLLLLWLWWGPAAAALIGPLLWELPYAIDVALKTKKGKINKTTDVTIKRKKKKKKEKN